MAYGVWIGVGLKRIYIDTVLLTLLLMSVANATELDWAYDYPMAPSDTLWLPAGEVSAQRFLEHYQYNISVHTYPAVSNVDGSVRCDVDFNNDGVASFFVTDVLYQFLNGDQVVRGWSPADVMPLNDGHLHTTIGCRVQMIHLLNVTGSDGSSSMSTLSYTQTSSDSTEVLSRKPVITAINITTVSGSLYATDQDSLVCQASHEDDGLVTYSYSWHHALAGTDYWTDAGVYNESLTHPVANHHYRCAATVTDTDGQSDTRYATIPITPYARSVTAISDNRNRSGEVAWHVAAPVPEGQVRYFGGYRADELTRPVALREGLYPLLTAVSCRDPWCGQTRVILEREWYDRWVTVSEFDASFIHRLHPQLPGDGNPFVSIHGLGDISKANVLAACEPGDNHSSCDTGLITQLTTGLADTTRLRLSFCPYGGEGTDCSHVPLTLTPTTPCDGIDQLAIFPGQYSTHTGDEIHYFAYALSADKWHDVTPLVDYVSYQDQAADFNGTVDNRLHALTPGTTLISASYCGLQAYTTLTVHDSICEDGLPLALLEPRFKTNGTLPMDMSEASGFDPGIITFTTHNYSVGDLALPAIPSATHVVIPSACGANRTLSVRQQTPYYVHYRACQPLDAMPKWLEQSAVRTAGPEAVLIDDKRIIASLTQFLNQTWARPAFLTFLANTTRTDGLGSFRGIRDFRGAMCRLADELDAYRVAGCSLHNSDPACNAINQHYQSFLEDLKNDVGVSMLNTTLIRDYEWMPLAVDFLGYLSMIQDDTGTFHRDLSLTPRTICGGKTQDYFNAVEKDLKLNELYGVVVNYTGLTDGALSEVSTPDSSGSEQTLETFAPFIGRIDSLFAHTIRYRDTAHHLLLSLLTEEGMMLDVERTPRLKYYTCNPLVPDVGIADKASFCVYNGSNYNEGEVVELGGWSFTCRTASPGVWNDESVTASKACTLTDGRFQACSERTHSNLYSPNPLLGYTVGNVTDGLGSYCVWNNATGDYAWRVGPTLNDLHRRPEACLDGYDSNCNGHLQFWDEGGNHYNLDKINDSGVAKPVTRYGNNLDRFDPVCASNLTVRVYDVVSRTNISGMEVGLFFAAANGLASSYQSMPTNLNGYAQFGAVPWTDYLVAVNAGPCGGVVEVNHSIGVPDTESELVVNISCAICGNDRLDPGEACDLVSGNPQYAANACGANQEPAGCSCPNAQCSLVGNPADVACPEGREMIMTKKLVVIDGKTRVMVVAVCR